MSARGLLLHSEVKTWLPLATDLELELFLRTVANEINRRGFADAHRLFDYARVLERHRLGAGPRENSH